MLVHLSFDSIFFVFNDGIPDYLTKLNNSCFIVTRNENHICKMFVRSPPGNQYGVQQLFLTQKLNEKKTRIAAIHSAYSIKIFFNNEFKNIIKNVSKYYIPFDRFSIRGISAFSLLWRRGVFSFVVLSIESSSEFSIADLVFSA